MNDNLLMCKSATDLVCKLKSYYQNVKQNPSMDDCTINEAVALMIELYGRSDYEDCQGYSYLNAILFLLIRQNVTACVSFERDAIHQLQDYLFVIVNQSVCPSLLDSSLRLLAILYLENTLNSEEKKSVEKIIEVQKHTELLSVLRKVHSQQTILLWMTFAGILLAILFAPILIVYRILLILGIIPCLAVSYYLYSRSLIRQLQRSISEGTIDTCPGNHTKLPALLAETTTKYQQFLITKDVPAKVQVGERIFNSGTEAIQTLTSEIEARIKGEVTKTTNPIQPQQEEIPIDSLLTPMEMEMKQRIKDIQNQPFPVSASLRNDLVELIQILEKNGKNPELLKKTKEDLAFFDTVVVKRAVELSVYLK
ncbi:hypothetical protein WA171_000124 [Blastocystis sp. BT1]